jgi:hypothetical protein
MTFRPALFAFLDAQPARVLSGWDLYDVVEMATGRRPYPPSILKAARDYADKAGAVFDCVDKARSLYQYEPGVKVSGAIVD